MKITWLGHSGFRIEAGEAVLLIDPWLRGDPVFEEARFDEAIAGATHVFLTHGHGDHAGDAMEISAATGAEVVGMYDLITWLQGRGLENGVGMNKGGTVECNGAAVTMVNAVHSSSFNTPEGPVCVGSEAGFMITLAGETIYFMGDTDVMADMALFQELHAPSIGIVPIGGRFTMDAPRAAFACRRFFSFKIVIPCHYKTFPFLAQDAGEFAEAMRGTGAQVQALDVMGAVEV